MSVAQNSTVPTGGVQSSALWLKHLSFLMGLFGVSLLISWLSGGFPGATWKTLITILLNFSFLLANNGPLLFVSLIFHVFQSLLILIAWLLWFWGLYREGVAFYNELIKPGVKTKSNGHAQNTSPLQLSGAPALALPAPLPNPIPTPAPVLPSSPPPQPEPTVIPEPTPPAPPKNELKSDARSRQHMLQQLLREAEKNPFADDDEGSSKTSEPEIPQQPEPKVIRKKVARAPKSGYKTANPFEGPAPLPEIMFEEEKLKNAAHNTLSADQEFALGNPFEGPGELPEILREEDRLANAFDDPDIEEVEIVNGVERPIKPAAKIDDLLANPFDDDLAMPTPKKSVSFEDEALANPFADDPFDKPEKQQPASNAAQSATAMQQLVSNTTKPSFVDDDDFVKMWQSPSEPSLQESNLEQTLLGNKSKVFEPQTSYKPASTPSLENAVKVASVTHTGIVHAGKENQDANYAYTSQRSSQIVAGHSQSVGLLLVADGMGDRGKSASSLAINAIRSEIEPVLLDPSIDADTLKSRFVGAVQKANKRLFAANQEQSLSGYTTLTGVTFIGIPGNGTQNFITHVINIGDSRAYSYSPQRGFAQITRDHHKNPQTGQPGRVLGLEDLVAIDVSTLTFTTGDRLLLCTDGLWSMLNNQKLAETLSLPASEPAHITSLFLQHALESGGADNVTAVVLLTD